MGRDTGYILKQAGCVPFEITASEYNTFVGILKEKRVERVREEIMNLAAAIGSPNAKNAVRAVLKELEG